MSPWSASTPSSKVWACPPPLPDVLVEAVVDVMRPATCGVGRPDARSGTKPLLAGEQRRLCYFGKLCPGLTRGTAALSAAVRQALQADSIRRPRQGDHAPFLTRLLV